MARQTAMKLALVLAAVLAGGACASTGTKGGAKGGRVANVPRPFPGAPAPPTTRTTPDPITNSPPAVATPGTLPTAPGVVATALTLRGTPYHNGGSQPSDGFDCSGFVQWVFAQHGTVLPRDVKRQFDAGEKIDGDDLKPGDLVFFETVSHGPSHVGIAIGGDEFVHAPSSKGVVRIERISSTYWSKRWVGAKRVRSSSATTDRLAD